MIIHIPYGELIHLPSYPFYTSLTPTGYGTKGRNRFQLQALPAGHMAFLNKYSCNILLYPIEVMEHCP